MKTKKCESFQFLKFHVFSSDWPSHFYLYHFTFILVIMDIELIVGEGSLNRPLHIEQVPPGIWKFKARSIPFYWEMLKDFTEDLRELIYSVYPSDRAILQQLFDGDKAFWSKVRKGCVPQVFFYVLYDGKHCK